MTREILAAKGGIVGEKLSVILPKFRLPSKFRDLLHAANLQGTDGFTSPLKEGVLRIFFIMSATMSQNFSPNDIKAITHSNPVV